MKFIINIPEYLRRTPKEFTSFKLKNILFQITFIHILFWIVLLVWGEFVPNIYPDEDTSEIIGLIGVFLAGINLVLFTTYYDRRL